MPRPMPVTDDLVRYRHIARLGVGGMATVTLAEDTMLGRRVALKRLHAGGDAQAIPRLRREALVGASLSHPNLVSIYDVEEGDGRDLVIVMEYVAGETLREAIAASAGGLEPAYALEVLGGVAAALDAIHVRGIVHRDVKPANILLGRDGAVKLADLGIAMAADRTQITSPGVILGTYSYMAPEQLEGDTATPAADVYALAAVAFEMLSGQKARPQPNPVAVAHAIATRPPPDLCAASPGASPAVAAVLARGMAADPARRPRSAGELVDRLRAALAPGGATQPPATPADVVPGGADPAPGSDAGDPSQPASRPPSPAQPTPSPPPVPRPSAPDAAGGLGLAAMPGDFEPEPEPELDRAEMSVAPDPEPAVAVPVAPPPRPVPRAPATARAPAGPARAPQPTVGRRTETASPRAPRGRSRLILAGLGACGLVALALALAQSGGTGGGKPAPSAAATGRTPAKPAVAAAGRSGGAGAAASATAGPAATGATPAPQSPAGAVETFYGYAARHEYAAAWALADPAFRAQLTGYDAFVGQQSHVVRITFDRVATTSQGSAAATVAIQTISVTDSGTHHCQGPVELVRSAGGGWLLHQISINCVPA